MHPEGTLKGLNAIDDAVWSLERYLRMLDEPEVLEFNLNYVGWGLERGHKNSNKDQLRYHGLKLLKETSDDFTP